MVRIRKFYLFSHYLTIHCQLPSGFLIKDNKSKIFLHSTAYTLNFFVAVYKINEKRNKLNLSSCFSVLNMVLMSIYT